MFLGVAGKRLGFIPTAFVAPANRLIYYFAIPFLVFLKVAQAPFREAFHLMSALCILAAFLAAAISVIILSGFLLKGPNLQKTRASFIQTGVHGNIGYVGVAVIYYVYGDRGLTAAAFMMAILILLQNVFSILILTRLGASGKSRRPGFLRLFKPVLLNPVIIALVLGVAFSVFSLPLPDVLKRSMEMIAGMALPLALLIIGATLSLGALSGTAPLAAICLMFKLLLLPAAGTLLFWMSNAPPLSQATATVLLAAPTATVTVVMGAELGGDPQWAANMVSLTTLCSMATYYAWLYLFHF